MNTLRPAWRRWQEIARLPVVERLLILLKACLVTGIFFYPVWWIHIHFTSVRIPHVPLSLAVSFLGVEIAAILSQLCASSAVKKYEELLAVRSLKLRPKIRDLIAGHFRGEAGVKSLRRMRRIAGRDVETCMAEALAGVSGTARERLSKVAAEIGLMRRWRRRAMRGHNELKESIELVSLLSPRYARPVLVGLLDRAPGSMRPAVELALARFPEAGGGAESRFDSLTAQPLLVRAMVAGEIRGEEGRLAVDSVPWTLPAGDPSQADAALEFLAGWRRAIPLPWLRNLASHPVPRIRARAMELAPLAARFREASLLVARAIRDADADVSAAAIEAAGRLRMQEAIPALAALAEGPDERLARAACAALARMDAAGEAVLKRQVLSGSSRAAAFAAASLGEARMSVELR